jgi:hypothetical protein
MFDDIPVTVWLSISLLIMAYLPARHVFRHIAHAPSRRDITLPREDLSWRTPRALFISLAALAALLAVGVYIHTPAAERFARSPEFMPLLMATMDSQRKPQPSNAFQLHDAQNRLGWDSRS